MAKKPADIVADAAADPQPAPDLRRPKATAAAKGGAVWDVMALPDDCPVIPLGHLAGVNYVLDHARQLRPLSADCRKGEVMMLFGHVGIGWLVETYPQYAAPKGNELPYVKGFDQTKVQEALIAASSRKGLFDPQGRTRGRGAHPGESGELVLHCGDRVLVAGVRSTTGAIKPPKQFDAGLVGRHVYPALPEITPPAASAATTALGQDVLGWVRKWRWSDPSTPVLVVGFLMAAMFGGALKWRPHMWIVGPSGAGKSTLQEMMRALLGAWAVFTEDATEAGLRQLLNQDTLGVMFDEFEPSESNKAVMDKVVRLARLASSGGAALRGSAEGKAAGFVARSCFLFSSIQYQAMEAQDRNRIAVVALSKIPEKTERLKLPKALPEWGDQLRRRFIEQWHRFDETLAAYQGEMFNQGFSAREQDTYGTLLACADMVLHDGIPDPLTLTDDADRVRDYVGTLAPSLDRSRGESEDNATRCLRRLASHRLPAKSGQDQRQVSEWIGQAFAELVAGMDLRQLAQQKLISHGMAIVVPPENPASESGGAKAVRGDAHLELHVAVAGKDHQGITEIFAGSLWAAGMWAQTLATIPGARASKKVRLGADGRCVTIPISEFIDVAEWRTKAADMLQDAERVG
jgi:hypothetical protein